MREPEGRYDDCLQPRPHRVRHFRSEEESDYFGQLEFEQAESRFMSSIFDEPPEPLSPEDEARYLAEEAAANEQAEKSVAEHAAKLLAEPEALKPEYDKDEIPF